MSEHAALNRFLLLAAACFAVVYASPNDECPSAISVSIPETVFVNITRARTTSGRRVTCSLMIRDVWYKTPTVAAGTVIRVSATHRDGGAYDFPITFAAYRDCNKNSPAIACSAGRDLVFIAPGGPLLIRAGSRTSQHGSATFIIEEVKRSDPQCDATSNLNPTGAASPFLDLTPEEMEDVRQYLLSQTSLELTSFAAASDQGDLALNYIQEIELADPPKADALNYLDNDGPLPARNARVLVYFGARNPPTVRYLEVGPLPLVDGQVTVTDVTPNGGIPYFKRTPCDIEYALMEGPISAASDVLKPLMLESYGGYAYTDCDDKCLSWTDTAPRAWEAGQRMTWLWFFFYVEGAYLQTVGLEFLVNHTSLNPAEWSVAKIIYNYQMFDSAEALLEAYNNGPLNKTVINTDDLSWSAFERRVDPTKPPRPNIDKFGPRLYEPSGKRFSVNGNHIEYMGWTMDYNWRHKVGMFLWDVKYLDERILYELGVAEASATYSGYSAEQSWTVYTDTTWGMGTSMYSMRLGYDCPHTAVLIDIPLDTAWGPLVWQGAVCVFEQPNDYAQRRHYNFDYNNGFDFYSSTPSHSLVVRTMPAVYNYDYVVDYIFYLNGIIEVRTAASGYLQAAFYNDAYALLESPYTVKLHDHVSGALHDHVFGIKADFDIVDTANSLVVKKVKARQEQLPWFPVPVTQKYLETTYIEDEGHSGLEYSYDQPGMWFVVNRDHLNKWGNERGYRLVTHSPLKMLPEIRQDWRYESSAWKKYQVLATKHHDDEQMPTSVFDQAFPVDPVTDVERWRANNESIAQQDIVTWLSFGHFHFPSAEDVPVTNVPGTLGSFVFKPHNFFNEDPTMDLLETVRATSDYSDADHPEVIEAFGMTLQQACVPSNPLMGEKMRGFRTDPFADE